MKYSIEAGDDSNDFEILQNGTILTRNLLDRESKSGYNLIVRATDCAPDLERRLSSTVQVSEGIAGNLGSGNSLDAFNWNLFRGLAIKIVSQIQFNLFLLSPQQVSITLKDVNDVSPVFVTANHTSIIENIPINTVVMAIKATDRDEGRNGYIEYNLSSAEKNVPFTLGPVDGLLRVSGRLDRELRSNYDLTVTARDRGEPPKSAKTKISVKILDENDNSPVFDPKQYSASIAENASIGAMVLQVRGGGGGGGERLLN